MTESETVEWAVGVVVSSDLKDDDTILVKVGALRQLQETIRQLRGHASNAGREVERQRQEMDERFCRDWV